MIIIEYIYLNIYLRARILRNASKSTSIVKIASDLFLTIESVRYTIKYEYLRPQEIDKHRKHRPKLYTICEKRILF